MTTARRTLLACERRLTCAERTGDATALRALLARDFVGVNAHGQQVDRRAFIAGFARPELRLSTLRIHDVVTRFVGGVALVAGGSRFSGTFDGKPISGRARFLDVWAPREGAWQLVASSVTRPAE